MEGDGVECAVDETTGRHAEREMQSDTRTSVNCVSHMTILFDADLGTPEIIELSQSEDLIFYVLDSGGQGIWFCAWF